MVYITFNFERKDIHAVSCSIYAVACIAYRNNLFFKLLIKDNNWSTRVQCMAIISDFWDSISVKKDAISDCDWLNYHSKETRHSFKCCSNAFKVSLTNTYPQLLKRKKWSVISIVTSNSGQKKDKIWPVMSIDRPLFRPLLYTIHINFNSLTETFLWRELSSLIWDKLFKNVPSKTCGRQSLKVLRLYGLFKGYFS